MIRISWLRGLALGLAVVLFQVAIFDQFRFLELSRIDLPLLLIVATAFVASPKDCARFGFVLGLMVDLTQFGLFGFNGAAFALAGWLIPLVHKRSVRFSSRIRSAQGAFAVSTVTGLTWLAGAAMGYDARSLGYLALLDLAITALSTTALIHPFAWLTTKMVSNLGLAETLSLSSRRSNRSLLFSKTEFSRTGSSQTELRGVGG